MSAAVPPPSPSLTLQPVATGSQATPSGTAWPAGAAPGAAPAMAGAQDPGATPRLVIPAGQFACLTGFVVPQPPVGIPFAGTHLLLGLGGQVIASLESATVNLDALSGQFVSLCGTSRGEVEGVPVLTVTAAFASPLGVSPLQVPALPPLLQWVLLQQFLLSALQGPASYWHQPAGTSLMTAAPGLPGLAPFGT